MTANELLDPVISKCDAILAKLEAMEQRLPAPRSVRPRRDASLVPIGERFLAWAKRYADGVTARETLRRYYPALRNTDDVLALFEELTAAKQGHDIPGPHHSIRFIVNTESVAALPEE